MVASAYTRRQRSRRQISSKEKNKERRSRDRTPTHPYIHGSNFARHLARHEALPSRSILTSRIDTVTPVAI
jgi:hypothetical protein